MYVPSNVYYKSHLCGQLNCWSLRCSCSNYIFILNWIHGFNRLDKDNWKTRRETFKFWDLVRLILPIWRCVCSMEACNLAYQIRTTILQTKHFEVWNVLESSITQSQLYGFPLRQNVYVSQGEMCHESLRTEILLLKWLNSSLFGQNVRHFTDGISKCILWMTCFVVWFEFHWSLFLSV